MFISTNSAAGSVAIPAHDGWIVPGQENRGRGSFEVRAIFGSGTTTVNLAVETATDVRNPDGSPTAICTARTTNGVQDPEATPVTVALSAKQAYRYVWVLSSSSGVGGCWVSGWAETFQA